MTCWPLRRVVVILSVAFFNLSSWLHQMKTFSALLTLCAGNSSVTGEFLSHRPVTRSFDVSFDLALQWDWLLGQLQWNCSQLNQMETFSALLALCEGKPPVTSKRSITPSFDVFFDVRLSKRLSKQLWCWWFETQWLLIWRHCNGWYGCWFGAVRTSIYVTGCTMEFKQNIIVIIHNISTYTNLIIN